MTPLTLAASINLERELIANLLRERELEAERFRLGERRRVLLGEIAAARAAAAAPPASDGGTT